MKLTFSKVELIFSAFSIVLYLVLMVLLISLGFWQLGRAEQKQDFLNQQSQSAKKTSVKLLDTTVLADVEYRRIELSGRYDVEHQYLIDNQVVAGRAGYYVMTPLKLTHLKRSILVNRGWVLNKDRRILPDITIANLDVSITGRVNHFPGVGLQLTGAEIPTENWPSVVQLADSKILSDKLGYPLFPFQVELDQSVVGGYVREWKNQSIMPPEKHVAYAVQWFGLALTLTLLFLGFSKKSK